ncbi:MAG: prolipoprotein diacylglyceryl transferase [Firmicutes bacterium]|nr:prolipoprotein diacylglyceryl transferase [Bacillota bacterium]
MAIVHPYLFKWGPITVWSYGFMLDVGFVLGAILAAREADRRGIGGAWIYDLLLVVLVAGVVVSRAVYVLLNFNLYASDPWTILNITEGGLALHGALLGGLLAAVWFCRRRKISIPDLADTLAPSLALGIGITRWGCFLNGCCYGVPTSGSWGVLTRYAPGLRHPVQIYESVLDFALFGFLLWVRTRAKAKGQLFALFLMLYSSIRFFVEFFRESSYVGPLTHAQAASLAIALGALWWFFRLDRLAKPPGRGLPLLEGLDDAGSTGGAAQGGASEGGSPGGCDAVEGLNAPPEEDVRVEYRSQRPGDDGEE